MRRGAEPGLREAAERAGVRQRAPTGLHRGFRKESLLGSHAPGKSAAASAEKAEPLTLPADLPPPNDRAQRGRAARVEFTPLGKSHK